MPISELLICGIKKSTTIAVTGTKIREDSKRPSRKPVGTRREFRRMSRPRIMASTVSATKYHTKGRAATFVAASASETKKEIRT